MKKRTRNLIIMLVVLALLVAAYLAVTAINKANEQKKADEEAANTAYVGSITDANKISYYVDGELISFTKNSEGTWIYDAEPDFPIRESFVTRIATAVNGLTAKRSVGIEEELSSYGLSDPANVLTVSDENSTLVLKIGKESGDDYFCMEDGGDRIYTIASTIPGYLDTGIYDMATIETMASVSEDEVNSVVLSDSEKSFKFLKVTKKNGSYTWYSEQNGERGEQIADYTMTTDTTLTASEILDEVLSTISSQTFTSAVDYRSVTDYGLGKDALRVEVNYTKTTAGETSFDETSEKGSYTLLVGNKVDDDCYYATLEGSDMVYTISADDVTELFSALEAIGIK